MGANELCLSLYYYNPSSVCQYETQMSTTCSKINMYERGYYIEYFITVCVICGSMLLFNLQCPHDIDNSKIGGIVVSCHYPKSQQIVTAYKVAVTMISHKSNTTHSEKTVNYNPVIDNSLSFHDGNLLCGNGQTLPLS